ncbi:MAG: ABC transporter ATP-binding protein [Oscillospiraceae bacterium]|nr:ABC transporter ATP-binding protein [Oscillospiraceae bacterium]
MAKRNTFGVDENLETPFNIKHLLRAGKYIKRHGLKMFIALIMASVSAVVALFIPKISQWVLDDAVPNKNYSYLLRLLLIYVGILAGSILLNVIRARLMAHAAQGIIYDIREDLFAHLQKLPFTYYDSRPTGKILVRVVNYVNSVADILSNGILNMVMECITLILVAIFMFGTDVKLAFVIVAGLPIFVGWILLIKPRQRRAWQAQSNKASNFNAYLAESLDGSKVSELFARQGANVGTCKELLAACRKTWMDAIYISNSVWLFSVILTQVVSTFLYLTGVYWYGGGLIVSFGILSAMSQYASRFWAPITNLANIYNSFINNIAYLERIFETMDEPITIDDAPDAVELPEVKGEVTFDHVTFGYEEGIHVLEDINFHINPGESIALVGQTGSGKTTIVNLISRFYDLNGGAVLLDGKYDVSKVTLKSLRDQMGIMMQDSFIFTGTIRDNIRYGKLDATQEEIERAAKAVCAHDFIEQMDNGYDTAVSERGGRLSQGQKQLISFARTLLSDPKILILDEATSSIDTKTEKLLQNGIDVLMKGRTSFIVAHRLSTIRKCDRIFFIGNKQILEAGSHEELMAKHGLYYQLYTTQMGKRDSE